MKITREEFKELVQIHKGMYVLWVEMGNYLSDDCFDRIAYPALDWIEEKLKFKTVSGDSLLWETHSIDDIDKVYDEWLEGEFKDESI